MIYATPAELAAYLDPDAVTPVVPPLATVLLRSASQLVLDAIAGAVYRADVAGLPTDPGTLAAVKNATMEQASAWSLHGLDPRKGAAQASRRIASKSVTGVSVTYVADPAADGYLSDLAGGQSLTSAAYRFLLNAGLISNRARTGSGGVETFNVAQRYYDPLTGALDG
jgi:hypothetical protein